jgi:hypothetical protein
MHEKLTRFSDSDLLATVPERSQSPPRMCSELVNNYGRSILIPDSIGSKFASLLCKIALHSFP